MSDEGFKLAARRKKCLALCGAIDACVLSKGISPFDQAARIVLLLAEWKDSTWAALSKTAGVNLPSDVTRGMVAEVYRGRATAPVSNARAS